MCVKDVQIAGDFWVVCLCQTTWDYLCNTAPHCCVFSSQHGQQQQQQQQQVNRNSQEDKEKEEKEKEAERDEEKNDTEDKEDGMK